MSIQDTHGYFIYISRILYLYLINKHNGSKLCSEANFPVDAWIYRRKPLTRSYNFEYKLIMSMYFIQSINVLQNVLRHI